MRICIFGAGAIGGMLGSLLKKSGVDVILVARGEHFRKIKEKGLIFQSKEYDLDVCQKFEIYDNIDDIGNFDLLISGLKAHSSNKMAFKMSQLLKNNSIFLPTLNGVPWWFFYGLEGKYNDYKIKTVDPDNLQWDYIKPSRVIGSVVYPAAEINSPGTVKHIEGKRFILGEPNNLVSERVSVISKLFYSAGIKAPISKDIRSDIWLKLIGNSSFNPISVITNSHLKDICENDETRSIVMKMMAEASAIGLKFNLKLKLDIEKRIEGAKKVGEHKTSTLQDYENKKPLEIDALTKVLIELGSITNTSTNTIETVYKLTKYLAKKRNCYPD